MNDSNHIPHRNQCHFVRGKKYFHVHLSPDGDPDVEKPFYILKHTYCAAVLTENGFMDSEVSLSFLESEEGKKAIVALHVDGIIDYIETR